MEYSRMYTGLVPAAGFAKRLDPIPCSKEIFPIGFEYDSNHQPVKTKVVSSTLFNQFRREGCSETYVIIRKGKWDIPNYYGASTETGLNLAFIVTRPTSSTVHTIDKAYPFIRNKHIMFGFPDIHIQSKHPYRPLIEKQKATDSDVVLGLFKSGNPRKTDMVETDSMDMVKNIVIKPKKTDLIHTWLIAVWSPAFTEYLHQYLQKHDLQDKITDPVSGLHRELYLGDIFLKASIDGLTLMTVTDHSGTYTDIGTLGDLQKSIKKNL